MIAAPDPTRYNVEVKSIEFQRHFFRDGYMGAMEFAPMGPRHGVRRRRSSEPQRRRGLSTVQ